MRYFILLKQDGLSFFSANSQPKLLPFPPTVVLHQEVINQRLFEELLASAFSHFPNQEAVLFLSDELVFSKQVPLTASIVMEDELQKFTDSIPFSSDSVEKKVIKTKANLIFFATNSDLYKTIATIAQNNKSIIKSVVPRSLFGPIPAGQQVSYNLLSHFAHQKDIIKKGDYLQILKPEVKGKGGIPKQIIILLVCLLILGGVIFWAASSGFLSL